LFGFISPFAYLQLAHFHELSTDLTVHIKPVVFGALLKHHGQLGPAEIPSKLVFTYRVTHWKPHRRGLVYKTP